MKSEARRKAPVSACLTLAGSFEVVVVVVFTSLWWRVSSQVHLEARCKDVGRGLQPATAA